jgi:hypothetical protein
MKFNDENMLGHWKNGDTNVCEFQHGSMLFFVEYEGITSKNIKLTNAQTLISEVLEDIPLALKKAIVVSKNKNPTFWNPLDGFEISNDLLMVFSIRFPSDQKFPIYEISWNPMHEEETVYHENDFFKDEPYLIENLPDENKFINLRRINLHQFEIVN